MANQNSALYTSLFVTKPPSMGRTRDAGGRMRVAHDVCAPGVAPVNGDFWVFGCVVPAGARIIEGAVAKWYSTGFTAAGTAPVTDLYLRNLATGVDSTRTLGSATAAGTTTYIQHGGSISGGDPALVFGNNFVLTADSVPVIKWSTGGGLPTGTAGSLTVEFYYVLD